MKRAAPKFDTGVNTRVAALKLYWLVKMLLKFARLVQVEGFEHQPQPGPLINRDVAAEANIDRGEVRPAKRIAPDIWGTIRGTVAIVVHVAADPDGVGPAAL